MNTTTTLAIAALIALLVAAPTIVAEGDTYYHPADVNQDCLIQFEEYTSARSTLLQGTGSFANYTFARSALLTQDPAFGYSQEHPEYTCTA